MKNSYVIKYIIIGIDVKSKVSMKIKCDKCVKGIHRYRYNSKRIVGRGKYSNVYAGIIEDTNEMIAIKKICLKKIANTDMIVIEREINTINKLMSIDDHNILL